MGKIKVQDANGNGKLDWYDVIVHYGTLIINTAIISSNIISKIL